MSALLRLVVCGLLATTLLLGGCSTVVFRTKDEEQVGVKHKINHSAFIFGLSNNPLKLPAKLLIPGRARRFIKLPRAQKGFQRDYAFSRVCIESTVGDWFLRVFTIGLYWPSTVTVWVVE